MKKFIPHPRFILKTLALLFAVLILLIFVLMPITMGFVATRSAVSNVGNPPQGYSEVELKTADNVKLSAWYRQPENGAVIILVHGAGDTRENLRKHIDIFKDTKFGVLAIDLRGHGESNGQTNRLGWQGTKDIKAGIEFLKSQENVNSIGALGLSMGGEILLGAASNLPEIEAFVSDGASYRSFAEFYDLPEGSPLLRKITPIHFMQLSVRIFSGENPPKITLKESIKKSKNTSFLFIAAGDSKKEIDYNKMFQETSQGRSETWIVPDTKHTKALNTHPDEYKQKVLQFFTVKLAVEEGQS